MYRRVPGEEAAQGLAATATSSSGAGAAGSGGGSTASNGRTLTRTRSERFVDKLVAGAWVSVAAGVAYWTKFFQVVFQLRDNTSSSSSSSSSSSEHQVNRPMLQLAAVGVGVLTVLALYLMVYLPKVVGLSESAAWDVYCPRVIPTMTIVAIFTSLALIRATWPVWGFLAPLILAIEAMGALFALHFIPSFSQ